MRRLLAWIFRVPLVWTKDFDGETRLRLVHTDAWVGRSVKGVGAFNSGILEPDGTISHNAYMRKWKPANQKAERMFS